MTLYRYTNSQTRDYPNLVHADGVGLRLEPGDTVDLDAAPVEDFVDGEPVAVHYPGCPWLVPADSVAAEIATMNAVVTDITAAVGLRPPAVSAASQSTADLVTTSEPTDTADTTSEPTAAD